MDKELPYRAITPPPRQRLSDTIAAQLEQSIVDGTLGPGHVLPAERVLAQKFGVSRPSLREALLRLESRGLLKVARGGGFVVTDVTAPTLTNPLVHLLQRYPTAEQDVLELRHGLEVAAAHFAALRATKADRARLRQLDDELNKLRPKHDALASAQVDAEFHLAIAEASHNVALIHVMHGLHNLLRTTMRHSWQVMFRESESTQLVQGQHRALLQAVLEGDPERARNAAHLHLNFVQETLLQLEPRGVPAKRSRSAAKTTSRKRVAPRT